MGIFLDHASRRARDPNVVVLVEVAGVKAERPWDRCEAPGRCPRSDWDRPRNGPLCQWDRALPLHFAMWPGFAMLSFKPRNASGDRGIIGPSLPPSEAPREACAKNRRMTGSGHLRPSRAIAAHGSLSPDSFRARRMLLTEEMGQKRALHGGTNALAVGAMHWYTGRGDMPEIHFSALGRISSTGICNLIFTIALSLAPRAHLEEGRL
jgi:hypothetical protein